jgi:hypothetical protein
LPIGIPLAEPVGVTAAGFRVDAANKAFSSKLKASAAVGATIDFFRKPLRISSENLCDLHCQTSFTFLFISQIRQA